MSHIPEQIEDPAYWADRFLSSQGNNIHRSIFLSRLDHWQRIEEKHREILAQWIQPQDRILDAGCGWGRLLSLMPSGWVESSRSREWKGSSLGVDLSPDFIGKARSDHRGYRFVQANLSDYLRQITLGSFDWAILISIRPMIVNNLGGDYWANIERELRRCCVRLLYLEYDERDEGLVE